VRRRQGAAGLSHRWYADGDRQDRGRQLPADLRCVDLV